MPQDFVPDDALGRVSREIGLAGTTLPRYILENIGWPQALIEDYDAKGRDQARGNNDVVQAAEGALTAQRWARTNQQLINGLTRRVSTIESQVTGIADLVNRVLALEMQIPMLQPQTGTGTPEGSITSNLSRTYYRIDGMTTEIWFNPVTGVNTGWVLMT